MTKETRTWDTVIKVGTALVWVLCGAVIMHEVRLSAIEGSRYTPSDALQFERATNDKFESLSTRLMEMGADVRVIRALLEAEKEDR